MTKKHRNRIILGIGLGIFVALLVAGYFPKGYFISGFGGTHNHKTLWDWLNLAGVVAVPLVLAWFGFRLQLQQQKRNQDQAKLERDIADETRQEEILQNYFNRISELLEKDLVAISIKGDDATSEEKKLLRIFKPIIRAITLSTIRRLDSQRNKTLTRFLCEADIIPNLVSFSGADLNGANLSGANLVKVDLRSAELRGADLKGTNLGFANLEGANLQEANLGGEGICSLYKANLKGAYLQEANLKGTDLQEANLEGANLHSANLEEASLIKAKLEGATLGNANLEGAYLHSANLCLADLEGANLYGAYLTGADLTEAIGLTKEQLEGKDPPFLCRTQLPEGIDIDPNRDCERIKTLLQLLQE